MSQPQSNLGVVGTAEEERYIGMKIWLLGGKVAKFYGEYDAFVVRAESPEIARELAIQFVIKEAACDNTASFRTCPIKEITVDGPPEILLANFKDG